MNVEFIDAMHCTEISESDGSVTKCIEINFKLENVFFRVIYDIGWNDIRYDKTIIEKSENLYLPDDDKKIKLITELENSIKLGRARYKGYEYNKNDAKLLGDEYKFYFQISKILEKIEQNSWKLEYLNNLKISIDKNGYFLYDTYSQECMPELLEACYNTDPNLFKQYFQQLIEKG